MKKLAVSANAPLPGIEHIVVLMFENRSFDNVLGTLYPPSDNFDGLPLDSSNTYIDPFKHTVTVTNTPPSGNAPVITPYPDPGESFHDMTKQIFGYAGSQVADMSGFAQNYFDKHMLTGKPGDIMFYFTPDQMPMTSFLASNFAVCDQWFASGPVQTFANRMFCHCGTPGYHLHHHSGKLHAYLNDDNYVEDLLGSGIEMFAGKVKDKSIFELLDGGNGPSEANWKVYFHDWPMSVINKYVNDAWNAKSPCVASYDDSDYNPPYGTSTFFDDVALDKLPAYAFIEPRYFDNYSGSGLSPNSNHPGSANYPPSGTPPIDVRNGELLLLFVYNTLCLFPSVFNKTLLIVTYDEHGGVYDHVPPNSSPYASTAVSPFPQTADNFNYDRFGVRVPTFFVNPMIPANTIYRPAAPSSGSFYPCDHTTIIATLREQFGLTSTLTPRDAAAPWLTGLISTNNTPRSIESLRVPASLKDWAESQPKLTGQPGPSLTPAEHERRMIEIIKRKAKR